MIFLKWLRVGIAAVVFLAFSALILDYSGKVPLSLHWIAHIQLVPAILDFGGVALGILAFWLIVTLLFGRVYCSVVCPLGIMQDVISRLGRVVLGIGSRVFGRKWSFRFRKAMPKTRYALLALFVVGLLGIPVLISFLDPYSHFCRIASALVKPVFLEGHNELAKTLRAPNGVSPLYHVPNHPSGIAMVVAGLALLLVGVLAFLFGRRYCNTICPVGTLLGLISRFSLFRIRLRPGCISCGICEKKCKGECIDAKNKTVDSSRCVACFNCLSGSGRTGCRRNAVVYTPSFPAAPRTSTESVSTTDTSKRRFLRFSFVSLFLPSIFGSGCTGSGRSVANGTPDATSAEQTASLTTASGLPKGVSRVSYEMTLPILPPGAKSIRHFKRHCTACHLCVAKCPKNILRPSTTELGASGFLQPVVKFTEGFEESFCDYNCTICTEVCPTRALTKLENEAEKHRVQIGRVVFLKENCVVHTQGTNCGACAEHCPTAAVKMVPVEGDPTGLLTIPETDPDLCVGCGACEYICPVLPYRAIYVDGLEVQGEAKPAFDPNAKQEEVQLDGFGF